MTNFQSSLDLPALKLEAAKDLKNVTSYTTLFTNYEQQYGCSTTLPS